LGAAGAWNTPFDEGWRAVREKPDAFAEAMVGATQAAMRGQGTAQVVAAAVGPLTERARDNRARLEERGRRQWRVEGHRSGARPLPAAGSPAAAGLGLQRYRCLPQQGINLCLAQRFDARRRADAGQPTSRRWPACPRRTR
jgi:hypothetical protein